MKNLQRVRFTSYIQYSHIKRQIIVRGSYEIRWIQTTEQTQSLPWSKISW